MLQTGALHGSLHLPLRVVVGHEVLRLLVHAERGHEHEPPHARLRRRGDEVARPLLHHSLELLGRAGEERHEMHDDFLALGCAPKARRIGHVPLHGLLARQTRAPARLPLEHAHGVPCVDERLDDRRADEPRPARDEDLHCSKFFQ